MRNEELGMKNEKVNTAE